MPEAINWTTIIISVLSAVATYVIAAGFTLAVAWGYLRRTMEDHAKRFEGHEKRFDSGDSEFKDQAKKDSEIFLKLTEIQATCKGRQRDCIRIESEHDGFRARLTQAESTINIMQVSISQIQQGLKEFREQIRKDMHEILQQYIKKG